MNAITPPTPENVADMLTSGGNGFRADLGWYTRLFVAGNVVSIEVETVDKDGAPTGKTHYRAAITEVTPLPAITPDPADWDWMEIVLFDANIESEGYGYAFDNYGPLFRRPELRALETDMGGLRAFMDAHGDAREAWEEGIGWGAWHELYDAHLTAHRAEAKQRRGEAQPTAAHDAAQAGGAAR